MLSMVGIYGFYFVMLFREGQHMWGAHYGGLFGTVVALIVVQVVLITTVAIIAP